MRRLLAANGAGRHHVREMVGGVVVEEGWCSPLQLEEKDS